MLHLWYNKENKSATAPRQRPVAWPSLYRRFDVAIIPSPRFCVYVLCRPDGRPFYVGKGSGKRVFDHEVEARNGHKCHKCNIIRKIWRQGGEIQRYTVFTTDDQEEAYAYERELIASIGREHLANNTDGGTGGRGRVVTPAERALHSLRSKVVSADPAWRAHTSAHRKAYWEDPSLREEQSERMRATWADPDLRAQRSDAIRERLNAPDVREKKSMSTRAWRSTPEQRAKMSAESKARWADPEFRARRTFQRSCDVCGVLFSAITVTARFCSQRCKHRRKP